MRLLERTPIASVLLAVAARNCIVADASSRAVRLRLGGAFSISLPFHGIQKMQKPRVTARDQIRLAASLLQIPEPFVRQVVTRMKTDGRLPATRPIATDVTPQSLARLLLGLCAPIPSRSTEIETNLGALPLLSGDGAGTVELELESLIAEAAGITDGDIDFNTGDLLIGVTNPVLAATVEKRDGSRSMRTYRRAQSREDDALTRYVRIPLPTLRLLALEVLP